MKTVSEYLRDKGAPGPVPMESELPETTTSCESSRELTVRKRSASGSVSEHIRDLEAWPQAESGVHFQSKRIFEGRKIF